MSNMVIRTNVLSLNSHRNLGLTGTAQARASARLSSGFRINSAADDAAGLGISEKMRGQIRGLDQASRNGQDGISLIQTAEGAMATINEMVIRIRELVVQAANDTNVHTEGGTEQDMAQSDRLRIQDEIDQLMDEINATRNRVEFNTRTLLDGSLAGVVDSVAAVATRNITVAFQAASTASVAELTASASGVGSISIPDTAVTPTISVSVPATGSGTFVAITSVASVSAATVSINITLPGQASRAGVVAGEAPALWFHVGANSDQGVLLSIQDVGTDHMSLLGENAVRSSVTLSALLSPQLADALSADQFLFSELRATGTGNARTGGVLRDSGEEINLFLVGIDMALAHVNEQRSNLGAMQNRLEYTIENLDIASENLQAANSRIRDADMAREMMRLTQMNVLQQAATAMLAQANQAPQMVLQLLG